MSVFALVLFLQIWYQYQLFMDSLSVLKCFMKYIFFSSIVFLQWYWCFFLILFIVDIFCRTIMYFIKQKNYRVFNLTAFHLNNFLHFFKECICISFWLLRYCLFTEANTASNIDVIIGATTGVLVALLIVCIIIILVFKSKKGKTIHSETNSDLHIFQL